MKNTQAPTLQEMRSLKTRLNALVDEDLKPKQKTIYNSKIDQLRDDLDKAGISKDLTLREAERALERWIEILSQTQETITDIPQYEQVDSTTPDTERLKQFGDEAEKRAQQKANIQAREKQAIENYIKQNEERIAKAKRLQEKLNDKVIYAKVVIPEPEKLTQDEQQKLETLKRYARDETVLEDRGLTPKQILINDLSIKIEEILEPDLKDLTQEEKLIVTQAYAVKLVEEISKPITDNTIPVQTAILAAIPQEIDNGSKIIQKTIPDDSLIKQAKEGSMALELEIRNGQFTSKEISKRIFGEKITSKIFGVNPEQIIVAFTDRAEEKQQLYLVNLGTLNKEYEHVLGEQNKFIGEIRRIGVDNIQNVFISEGRTLLRDKVTKSAVGKFMSKDPVLNAIFAQNVLGDRVVWKVVSQNRFAQLMVDLSPKAGPVLGLFGKATPIVTTVAIQPAGKAVASKIATQVAVKKGFGAIIGKILGFFAGTPAGPAGLVIGTAIGEAVSRIAQNIWSRVKVWWSKNKETVAPLLAVGAGLSLARFGFAPAVLGGVGTFALFGGSVAGLAYGTWRIFGLIGRSVGIAVATPVIVTLLVIPPLVAFIMLVINNSAYVVPPKPVADSPFDGSIGNFYCTEEKESTGITYSVNSPIAMRAFGIVEDLYQGFWCSWNRSPGDLPTDTVEYPDSYPLLFDMDEFRKNPNPIRGEVSGCGNCMFWCTWLVQKAYSENDVEISNTLWSPDMYRDFESRKKIILKDKVTPTNVELGAVVFFDVFNSENRIDHVAIVYSVNSDGITFVQSNAGTKKDFIPFNESGVGITDLPYATVIGIGNP